MQRLYADDDRSIPIPGEYVAILFNNAVVKGLLEMRVMCMSVTRHVIPPAPPHNRLARYLPRFMPHISSMAFFGLLGKVRLVFASPHFCNADSSICSFI